MKTRTKRDNDTTGKLHVSAEGANRWKGLRKSVRVWHPPLLVSLPATDWQ